MAKINIYEPLEHCDSINIGNDYHIDIFMENLNNHNEPRYNHERDANTIGDEYPTTYVLKDKQNNEIARVSGELYITGGEEGNQIDDANIINQRKAINDIVNRIPSLILTKINENEEQIYFLEKSLSSIEGKETEITKTDHVLKHGETVKLQGGNTVEVFFKDLGNHKGRAFDPLLDDDTKYDEWPTAYIVKDRGGYPVKAFKGEDYISGGVDDEVNIDRQNHALEKISRNLVKIMEDKVEANKEYNVKLGDEYDRMKKVMELEKKEEKSSLSQGPQ